jgi:hypothetical protein
MTPGGRFHRRANLPIGERRRFLLTPQVRFGAIEILTCTWRADPALPLANQSRSPGADVLNFRKHTEASKRIELGRLGKTFQLVRSERHDKRRIEQARKPLRH